MNKLTVTAGVALGLAVLAGWQLARDKPAGPTRADIHGRPHAGPAAPRTDLPASAAPHEASRAPAQNREPGAVANATAESQEVQAGMERGAPSTARLAARFGLQERDTAWADLMEVRLVRQLSQSTGLAVTSLEVSCRETVCRVRLFFPIGRRARPAQLNSLLEIHGLEPRIGFTFGEAGGVPVTTAYLERNDSRRVP